jgi:hypothetical protein
MEKSVIEEISDELKADYRKKHAKMTNNKEKILNEVRHGNN